MSVKHGLLALLADGPCYGNELRALFEQRTGGTWPLNVGQVYTTLDRLQRDGLVAEQGHDVDGHLRYALTDGGRAELQRWYAQPVDRTPPPRDELTIKVALAAEASGVELTQLLQRQRSATLSTLQALTAQKARLPAGSGPGALVVLDALIAAAEAEARFLDTCDARLTRGAR